MFVVTFAFFISGSLSQSNHTAGNDRLKFKAHKKTESTATANKNPTDNSTDVESTPKTLDSTPVIEKKSDILYQNDEVDVPDIITTAPSTMDFGDLDIEGELYKEVPFNF